MSSSVTDRLSGRPDHIGRERAARRTHATHARPARPRVAALAEGAPATTAEAPVAAPTAAPKKAWHSAYVSRLQRLDVAAAAVAGGLACLAIRDLGDLPAYVLLSLVLLLAWPLTIGLVGGYESRYVGASMTEFHAVPKALVGLLSLTAVATTFAQAPVSRSYLVVLLLVLPLLSLVGRGVLRHWLRGLRATGRMMQPTLVIGSASTAGDLARSLRREPMKGLEPVAACVLDGGELDPTLAIERVPVVGEPLSAIAAVDAFQAEVVAVAAHSELSGPALRRLAWALEERGVELVVAPGLLDVAGPRMSIRPSDGLALLHVERPAQVRRNVLGKALFDRAVAALLILALSPILLATFLAVRLTSAGPAVYRQTRVGQGGTPFTIFKFRTMVQNADAKLAELLAQNEGNEVQFKMKRDPRITPVGTFLRKYSIDELPQLFNVLNGTMSLVGPRPQTPREVALYSGDATHRLDVRPGMTGLWQVSGRSDLDWEQTVQLDLRYVDNWSPTLDTLILLRTFRAVFAGAGAY